MRNFVLELVVAGVVAVAVSSWSGRSTSQVPTHQATDQQPPAAIIVPTTAPSAVAMADCDEVEELMARMFVGLTEAVLTESGTSPAALASAAADVRETFRRYLEVLDIQVDEAWLEAVIDPSLDKRLLRECLEP